MPSPIIIMAILLAISVAGNALLGKLYVGAKQEVARVQQAYDSFTAQVKVAGEEAQKKADTQKMADKLLKDTADAENAATVARLTADIGKLRRERDSRAGGNVVPTTQACTASPEAIKRYATEYQSAYRDLVAGLREQGDRGSKAVTDLNTSKDWALAP